MPSTVPPNTPAGQPPGGGAPGGGSGGGNSNMGTPTAAAAAGGGSQPQQSQPQPTATQQQHMQPSPLQRSGTSNDPAATAAAAASASGQQQPPTPNSSAAAAAATAKPSNSSSKYDPQDQLVLDYLKRKGMTQAALELAQTLDADNKTKQDNDTTKDGSSGNNNESSSANNNTKEKTPRERFVEEDERLRAQRTLLGKTTGGGYGYDRDSAWPVVQWGLPDQEANVEALRKAHPKLIKVPALGVEEARALLDAFVSFQLWVLQLPDNGSGGGLLTGQDGEDYENIVLQSATENPIFRAQKFLDENKDSSVASVVEAMVTKKPMASNNEAILPDEAQQGVYNLPPSVKPELLAVAFALLVHTYADLLEVGMESTAQSLREAFAPVYQALYPEEYRDLVQCHSTEAMMRLNTHNSQHMESVGHLKSILVQVAQYQLRKDEYIAHLQSNLQGNALTPQQQQEKLANDPKVRDCDKKIHILQTKYKDMSMRATQWFDKMHDLPFLRRARATRWVLTLSTSTYAMLSSFLGSRDDSLVVLSSMLQTKCSIQVERRDPLPYTPACVLLDVERNDSSEKTKMLKKEKPLLAINSEEINWAVPAPRPELKNADEKAPFPRFHLEEEYENEEEVEKDQRLVEYNRSLLVNGFRRLEALERKREYEVLTPLAQKRARQGESISRVLANPLEPSILLSTLSASSAPGPLARGSAKREAARASAAGVGISAIWEEPGIGLCSAKADRLGRRVAAGCDDASVRIYNLENENGGGEPCEVLLGHKNGFPVFGVEWNRDGRALFSCGGDGSIRLWDTAAVGPFGQTTTPKPASTSKAADKKKKQQSKDDSDMAVPGWRSGEPVAYTSGAAIAVYRGHAPNTPVWSVSMAPCGYYFCSTGADATARIWTTDRPIPVRLLSGHTSANVNCAAWHPNANYVVTGCDDRTARLWDVNNGETVRILTGASAGINSVQISPGGRYCAGADYSGLIHLWDLGSGKKISIFRSPQQSVSAREQNILHSLTFSACGKALAAGGDDCSAKIWDIQTATMNETNEALRRNPHKSFPTRRTVVMDLQYTKRNLLLAVGKYVSPVPMVSPIGD